PGLDAGRADALVPDLGGLLIRGHGFGRLSVVGGGPIEDAHVRSLSERLMDDPPPPPSPERTACAVAVTPWLMAWLRRMFRAQAGGLPVAAAPAVAPPPTVPIEEVP